ncbi:hypothetical protein FRC10_001228 [Ceratobasidium sp. 414]|nr:hypothetical protein FRC10_001228 [Ceratobasidium sp. 414]
MPEHYKKDPCKAVQRVKAKWTNMKTEYQEDSAQYNTMSSNDPSAKEEFMDQIMARETCRWFHEVYCVTQLITSAVTTPTTVVNNISLTVLLNAALVAAVAALASLALENVAQDSATPTTSTVGS